MLPNCPKKTILVRVQIYLRFFGSKFFSGILANLEFPVAPYAVYYKCFPCSVKVSCDYLFYPESCEFLNWKVYLQETPDLFTRFCQVATNQNSVKLAFSLKFSSSFSYIPCKFQVVACARELLAHRKL